MNSLEILALPLDQISACVEQQVIQGRDRTLVLKEIASVRRDEIVFQKKVNSALKQ